MFNLLLINMGIKIISKKTKIINEKKINKIKRFDSFTNIKKETSQKEIISNFIAGKIISESKESISLYNRSRLGELINERIIYSFVEAYYLIEKKQMIIQFKGKKLSNSEFLKLAEKKEKNFWINFCVFKDIRDKGYIVKTALKFGAEFRIYDKGVKPGENHAKWIVYPVFEKDRLTWHDFSAKNRVAHSTKKNLLIGVVDEEGQTTYYEVKWIKP